MLVFVIVFAPIFRQEGNGVFLSNLKVSFLRGELSFAVWDMLSATLRVLSEAEVGWIIPFQLIFCTCWFLT